MQIKTDAELLRDYAINGSEAAFGEVVRRYADFVYSAALRQVSDPELARDVAQVVFVDLARKAGSLHPATVLIGWLCRGARLAALEQFRKQYRQRQRERQAMELADSSPEIPNDWSVIQPVLDAAIANLGDADRDALLLRFFKNESLASVGATLGVSEDAAQKRVSRALEKLREFLADRGINTTAATLAVVLAANSVQAAPPGFAASLAAGALAKAAAGSASIPLFKCFTANSMKTAILSLILAGGVAGLTVQQFKTQGQLRQAQATIQQQSQSLEVARATREQLAAQSEELQRLRAEAQDVVRLRGEVTRLRRETAATKTPALAQSTGPAGESATNSASPSVAISAKFVLLPAETLKALNVPWTLLKSEDGAGATGPLTVLTKEQFQAINQALEGASDVQILGSPRVVTSAGVEAKLLAAPMMSGARAGSVSGGEAIGGMTGPGTAPGHQLLIAGTNANLGMSLTVLPFFSEGSSTFDLQLTAGYSQSVDRSPQQDGSQNEVQLTETKARLTLAEGQTGLLAKEVPNAGGTDADNTVPGPKSLLVFITPSPFQATSRLANVVHRGVTNQQSAPKEN